MTLPRILHVGCGGAPLPDYIPQGVEVRLDIDAGCDPDIVASITDMGDIGKYDLVYSSHCLEHLYPHDLPKALAEFGRVTKTGGCIIAMVPDLEDIRPTEDVVYKASCGPIAGLDMFYGLRSHLSEMPFMAHHNGFVATSLHAAFAAAGLDKVRVKRLETFELMAVAIK